MVFIPTWISNILLFGTIVIAGYQHVKLRRPNPVTNVQFFMICFCIILLLAIIFLRTSDAWLSLGFFIVSLGCCLWMIRRMRYLPPSEFL